MATPQKRKSLKRGSKLTRRTAQKRYRYNIKGSKIIKENWDKKQTLKQNYERMGLVTSLNGVAGGKEKKYATPKAEEEAEEEELRELKDEDIETIKKSLRPGEGLIQRDDQGNVIRVIVGEKKSHDEILDEEVQPVEAKTDVVRALEEEAKRGVHVEKYQSEFEQQWIAKLIAKHGDNYKAMFWDEKLNANQHTINQLKKKVEKYLKSKSAA